jgi:hypothetical protein
MSLTYLSPPIESTKQPGTSNEMRNLPHNDITNFSPPELLQNISNLDSKSDDIIIERSELCGVPAGTAIGSYRPYPHETAGSPWTELLP